ncbi:MAG: hypothetical protein FWE50_00200 [Alphaproteobacteria bacterium]|nr:hypothetical protein [Alphaproteobacteria bacterium]
MRKIIIPVLLVSALAVSACSSRKDYCETSYDYGCGAVMVKTHTEVVDHYQTYRPVTVYQPAGTYSERRTVCNYCNY